MRTPTTPPIVARTIPIEGKPGESGGGVVGEGAGNGLLVVVVGVVVVVEVVVVEVVDSGEVLSVAFVISLALVMGAAVVNVSGTVNSVSQ
jgi:predicted metalloprotease